MELIFLITIFCLGFSIGKIHTYLRISILLNSIKNGNGLEDSEEDWQTLHELIIEKHNDILYLFEKESNRFICQASSVQELAKIAKEDNNIINAAVVFDNKIFTFVNGETTEFSG